MFKNFDQIKKSNKTSDESDIKIELLSSTE